MKKQFLLGGLLVPAMFCFAQPSRTSIEDSVFGWFRLYHYKGATESKKMDNRVYSIAQLSICDSFVNWIQASYIPKGGIGDVKKVVFPKQSVYSSYNIGLPQAFGVTSFLWSMEWKNDKILPIQETEIPWGIAANEVPGMSINMLSTEKQYYFFMEEGARFFDGTTEEVRNKYEIKTLPQFRKYTTWHLTSSRYDRNAGLVDAVLLCKNNQLPFLPVSIGELLQQTKEMIQVKHEEEKKKIIEKAQGNQRDIDYFTKYENEKFERAKASVAKLLDKYKLRLADPAALPSNYDYIDMANGYDLFTRAKIEESPSVPKLFPVYKLASNTYELCKKDQPQWILVTWSWVTGDAAELYMHESIINNFNFDYVYNFFFDPEKVKGQPYKPHRSPIYKDAVVVTEASEASKKNTTDKNIYFFEDFSTTGIGKKPIGWRAGLDLKGTTSVITKLEGLDGTWVVMNGDYTIAPIELKKPFPQDFTLSYELVAAQNFTWGAKGLTFQLSKELSAGNAESYVNLKLRPGYDGRDGEATIETKFPAPPGYSNGTRWFTATGFSNNKKNNRILVTIKKKDETLQVFIDKNKIAEYEKAIPATHLFNAISFSSGSTGENNKFYISNIKIIKD